MKPITGTHQRLKNAYESARGTIAFIVGVTGILIHISAQQRQRIAEAKTNAAN
jgi:hypothetical protein